MSSWCIFPFENFYIIFKFIACQEAGDYYFPHVSYNIGKPTVFVIIKLHLVSTVPLALFTCQEACDCYFPHFGIMYGGPSTVGIHNK